MAAEKPDLARAGTMQATSKEGKTFLDKNLTDWKKPYLMDQFEEEADDDTGSTSSSSRSAKKAKLSKHSTMKGTAKEAAELLADGGPDEDVQTRGQQKQLDAIKEERPPAKKSKMARDNTMAATAKEGKSLIGGDKLGDTRQVTKSKRKPAGPKRANTAEKAVAEAKAVYGDLDMSEGRSLRKRAAPPKAPLKKAGTMEKTAKEGKAFLKRGKKRPAKKIVEEDEDEESS